MLGNSGGSRPRPDLVHASQGLQRRCCLSCDCQKLCGSRLARRAKQLLESVVLMAARIFYGTFASVHLLGSWADALSEPTCVLCGPSWLRVVLVQTYSPPTKINRWTRCYRANRSYCRLLYIPDQRAAADWDRL